MRDLPAIAALYEEVDNFLESDRPIGGGAGDAAGSDTIDRRQRINDQAYFVLAWGQLEAEVLEVCRDTIRRAQSHRDRRSRRAWMLYDPDDRRLWWRLSFENRLTLVLDRDAAEWKLAMQHYNLRNQIAHGRLRPKRIEVTSVIQDFYRIHSSLARR